MSCWLRRAFPIIGVVAMLCSFIITGGTVSAASTTPAPVDFSSLQQNCSVLEVHLSGAQHTFTCLQAQAGSTTVSPNISKGCQPQEMEIDNINQGIPEKLCFNGTGYMGVRIGSVYEVWDWSYSYWQWFRYYWSTTPGAPGYFCSEPPRSSWSFGKPYVLVTQIDIGSSNGGVCF